jgi:hypothetical protein
MEQDLKAMKSDLRRETDAYKRLKLEREISRYANLIKKKKAQRRA